MKIRCKYCGSYMSDTDSNCPSCNATNDELKRIGNGVPKTIDELKTWYVSHNLPDENITRFFIGKDYKEPRAFGIYHDTEKNEFVVYKNKADGTRVIRYSGKDEEYAVNEIYQKLKEEMLRNRARKSNKNHNTYQKKDSASIGSLIMSPLFLIHFMSVFVSVMIVQNFASGFLFLSMNPGVFIMLLIFWFVRDEKTNKIINNIWHISSFVIFFILLFMPVVLNYDLHKNDSYYTDMDYAYYEYGNTWYKYEENTWNIYEGNTTDLKEIGNDYVKYNASDFKASEYYDDISTWELIKRGYTPSFINVRIGGSSDNINDNSSSSSSSSYDNSSSNDDMDSSSSWDSSDSWDSGSSDWDTDW